MKWTQLDKYFLQSGCKRYLIAKYSMVDGWKYQLTRGKESLCVGSLAECKAAAR